MTSPTFRQSILVFALPLLTFASQGLAGDGPHCELVVNADDERETRIRADIARMSEPDRYDYVERRIKRITDGRIDMADPSMPRQVIFPDGTSQYRIYTSGHRFITAPNFKDIMHGGIAKTGEVEVRYADGTKLDGPYHTGPAGWDGEPILLGTGERRAFLGMMEQPGPGLLPNVVDHNPTRSRHILKTEFTLQSGTWKEIWIDLGALGGNKPGSPRDWISRDDDGNVIHEHSYGSRVPEKRHKAWRDPQGALWVFYDVVVSDAFGKPYITEIRARRLDEKAGRFYGEHVTLMSVTAHDGQPFPASSRGEGDGYLVEGPNVSYVKIDGKDFWMLSFSAGNYVSDTYGMHIGFVPAEKGPVASYEPLLKENGDLKNVMEETTRKYDLTWGMGRINLFEYRGRLWGAGHAIPKTDLPDGFIKSGWPRAHEYNSYARSTFLIPFKVKLDQNGKPILAVDERDH